MNLGVKSSLIQFVVNKESCSKMVFAEEEWYHLIPRL